MSEPKSVSTERVIAAPADRIFAVLADPRQHAVIDGSGTVKRLRSGPDRLALGARFGMAMHHQVPYPITNKVVEFDEGRRIAWQHLARCVALRARTSRRRHAGAGDLRLDARTGRQAHRDDGDPAQEPGLDGEDARTAGGPRRSAGSPLNLRRAVRGRRKRTARILPPGGADRVAESARLLSE